MKIVTADAKSKATVKQLIRGSIEINRMREEIKIITGMIISNLREDELNQRYIDDQVERVMVFSPECSWKLLVDEGFGVTLRCFAVREHMVDILIPSRQILNRHSEDAWFLAQDTELIYRNLPVLIQWLFEAHPQIVDRLKPFLEVG